MWFKVLRETIRGRRESTTLLRRQGNLGKFTFVQVETVISSHIAIDKKGRKRGSPKGGLYRSLNTAQDVRASLCPHKLARSFKPVTYHPFPGMLQEKFL